MTKKLDKVLYTAQTHTTGGRDGAGKASDGALDVKLSSPGSGKPGTNPEQLFGIGYSACFIGAMQAAGRRSTSRCRTTWPSTPACRSARPTAARPMASP